MIAGILQDFNTYENEDSYVSLYHGPWNVTTIYYNRVYYFGELDPQLDFGIRLFPDGSINLLYDNVTQFDKLFSTSDNCSWLSGLIAPDETLSDGEYIITSEQDLVQKDVWAANHPGVYPSSRTTVSSNSHFIMCPISTAWGATPGTIDSEIDGSVKHYHSVHILCG